MLAHWFFRFGIYAMAGSVFLWAVSEWMLADADIAHASARFEAPKRISFARGETQAKLTGTISGFEVADYLLRARAGQKIRISVTSDPGTVLPFFYEPEDQGEPVHNGATNGSDIQTIAQQSGDYWLRLLLMRNEARRGTKSGYVVVVAVEP